MVRRASKRLIQRWRIAPRLVWVVIALQGAMLLTLFVTQANSLPPRVRFFELMWAWMHEPVFYPLAALLVGGPVLSVMAMGVKGHHRWWLGLSWIVFAILVYIYFPDRTVSMVRALYWSMTR